MANAKIYGIAMTILDVMTDVFPQEYRDFVFAGLLDPGDVVEMVMFDLIKMTYDRTEEKHSMRYFFEKYGITEQDQIMRYSRIQSYVQKYRKREYDFRTKESDFDILSDISALLPPDMSDMKTKLDGYQLTGMNFFELTTILENEFTKAFTELRLIDSKKIPNARFREIIAQYDNEILQMNGRWVKSDENIVFYTLAAFTLEWKYPINFIYSIVKRMEELGISEFPDQKSRMATFCADINYVSAELKARISTHSRMITVRDRYIDLMLQEPEGSLLFEAEQMAFLEGLTMVSLLTKNMTIDKVPIQEWFIKNTTKEDWASFFIDYDIFGYINGWEKQWSNKRIRYFRECLSMLLRRGGQA